MRSEKNIFVAFILNFLFSAFELLGGIFTGSFAILSDALHDFGDAASIGISYFLEKKSKKRPDKRYTYGYSRYSVLGGLIMSAILLFGSMAIIYKAVIRIFTPTDINYSAMIVFAIIGVCVNFLALFFTRGGFSLNQRAVSLHMLEDVLGWGAVLIGAVVMKFTDFALLDPIISIGVSLFIFINAVRECKRAVDVFLEKAPCCIDTNEIRNHICELDEVYDVHHIHLWSMDGTNAYATMHVILNGDRGGIKEKIRKELREHGVSHVTIELEYIGEGCSETECATEMYARKEDGHPHRHHHH